MASEARPDSDSDPDLNLGRVQSLVRAFGMLDELSKHDDGLTLTQVAGLVALPRSTAHRLLTTMEALRYVEFEQATSRWRVGVQAFSVGSAFAQTRDLARLGRPIMRSLMMDARETVNIATADADGVHYVAQVEATGPSAMVTRPGQHLEMHTTAAGKAMLAYWSEGQLDHFLNARVLASRTAASITEAGRLLDNLKLARRSGFAIDDQETLSGMRCVAAPVLDRDGLARASLSISGPASRMPLERLSQLGAMLAVAASRLTADIGGLQLPVGINERRRSDLLRELFDVAIAAVSAERCLPLKLPGPVKGKTFVLAVGKAGAAMARVAAARLPGRVEGIVLTRHGHSYPAEAAPKGFAVFEAGHPLPDEHGQAAAKRIFAAVSQLGRDDQLLALISGGASALLAMPADGLSLKDKQGVTLDLLASGASISEINCVRTHLSKIKGGRLAVAAAPAKVVTLALSDVPGDDPAIIGSGPTVPDRSRLADARRILDLYGIRPPVDVLAALNNPANETPDATCAGLADGVIGILARSQTALDAAGQLAHAAGYKPIYLGSDIEGESSEVATVHGALALHYAQKGGRFALISGGETTVCVRNRDGHGGRNTEYALALAIALDGAPGISAIACDTDGIDGTQDNAGAVIDADTLVRGRQCGLSAADSLAANETYTYFAATGDLVFTGPTRTNVNDFRAILIDGEGPQPY